MKKSCGCLDQTFKLTNRNRNFKFFKTALLFFSLVQTTWLKKHSSNTDSAEHSELCTLEEITRDSCREDFDGDNLSCPVHGQGSISSGLYCFSRSLLCDGNRLCRDNSDEGDRHYLEELNCKWVANDN